MAEPLLAEIRAFSFESLPRGWMACDGQLLPVDQNQALFSLLGNTYGGERGKTFALPDLRGRVAVGQGDSAGSMGASGGGSGAPQPYQALVYAIAVRGVFPSQG